MLPFSRRRGGHATLVLLCMLAAAGGALATAQAPVPGELAEVLGRVGAYVTEYERALGVVISEECYEQTVDVVDGVTPSIRQGPAKRRLLSEFLMVRLAAAPELWSGVRDVLEVDGKTVREREGRLERLLTGPAEDRAQRWRELSNESARFNIGPVVRNLNVPTFALVFLRPTAQPRSTFEKAGEEGTRGVRAWRIRFVEQRTPSIVRDTLHQQDLPMHGDVWVDPVSGRVLRSVLQTGSRPSGRGARIEVRYAPDARLGIWVPVEMRERYESRAATVTGTATYRKFRRFETEVKLIGG